jgi:hypothetical protein
MPINSVLVAAQIYFFFFRFRSSLCARLCRSPLRGESNRWQYLEGLRHIAWTVKHLHQTHDRSTRSMVAALHHGVDGVRSSGKHGLHAAIAPIAHPPAQSELHGRALDPDPKAHTLHAPFDAHAN